MLDRIVAKLVENNVRLDDERVKNAKFERSFQKYYAFRIEGKVYEFPAREFVEAYWERINNANSNALDLDDL